MQRLIRTLHDGGYSCVVRNGAEIRTCSRRGVADLYRLLKHDPAFLEGASVADKVVGKAAAALLAAGKVRRLHADTISTPALELLRRAGIETTYEREVDHIVDRTQTGWCPLELRCRDARTAEECLPRIEAFMKALEAQMQTV